MVTVDGGEITEHEWVRPAEAIAARDEGRVTLLPPTWLTLWDLAQRGSVDEVLAARPRESAALLRDPHRLPDPPGRARGSKDVVAIWEGDAGYVARDPSVPGARHRLRMGDPPWMYERNASMRRS